MLCFYSYSYFMSFHNIYKIQKETKINHRILLYYFFYSAGGGTYLSYEAVI